MKALTDAELGARTKEVAATLSYYNAGEGRSYQEETAARQLTQKEFDLLIKEHKDRGLVFDDTGFLVSSCYNSK